MAFMALFEKTMAWDYFGDLHKKISPPSTHKKIILVGFRFPSLLRAPK